MDKLDKAAALGGGKTLYDANLQKIMAVAEQVRQGEGGGSYPASINRPALRAIDDNPPIEPPAARVAEPGATPWPDPPADPRGSCGAGCGS
ncbi:hypothetical protein [Candidatus Palauibacter sp.]|uniref:hypothetical protein n=1 Tax=Candidatus Palauibacter sp. TaxID=3101350 RepID=UPI003B52A526